MARKGKAQQAREDAAYLASQSKLDQPDLLVESAQVETVPRSDIVPDRCPACGKTMTYRSGWATVFGDLLQCGGCGGKIQVPRRVFVLYSQALHNYFAGLKPPELPKKSRGKRERGAG